MPDTSTASCSLLAPAKLNLFLHVVGRQPDGYHQLQSLFCLIDWTDRIQITRRNDGHLQRLGDLGWPAETDLGLRAAHLLRDAAKAKGEQGADTLGADLLIEKHIPSGAGLGGGSSDAAAVLMGLNQLWGLQFSREALATLGLQLGADVPFFIHGQAAFVEGIGERMQSLEPACEWFVVLVPAVGVPTAQIFRDAELTRDSKALRISDLSDAASAPVWTFGHNDLEPVACRQFSAVRKALQTLQTCGQALGLPLQAMRMSGSGGAVFASCADRDQADKLASRLAAQALAEGQQIRVCRRLIRHPAH
ncbi:MAG: 4-(cytidine 5'-diphospho)-2-C-methyl-D-erythritol kinase [Burkholderiaceae bacterium]